MTTTPDLSEATIFFKQIHPDHFKEQLLWKSDFQGKNDPECLTPEGTVDTSYFAISVDVEHPDNSAQQSYERYVGRGSKSTGVVGVTKAEISSLGLALESKPRKENRFHWHIVFPESKNTQSTHKKLRGFATLRGWVYVPTGTLQIRQTDKPLS